MEQMEKIIAMGLLGTLCSLILKKEAPYFSFFTSILTGILIFTLIFSSLESVVAAIKSVFVKTDFDTGIVSCVLKICAIGLLGEYFCSIAEDCGESAIAKKTELASKIIIFTYTLPVIVEITETVWSIF